jgi:hypothetical protein
MGKNRSTLYQQSGSEDMTQESETWFGGFGPRNQTITDVMGKD